ncbi:uncharacterized protein [Littorina saxatilis]|uniref:Uncharacterized protein n=1 Tax=Littorina saxatilis TaxID=31220 RepID=A0AAN9GD41_9CAEN
MSTTLSVLHVLMAGRDVRLPGDVILGHGGLPALDPTLQDFWSAFPCPPPWNHALLFRVNWTACVGQAVGERLKWFLADRCNIPHDGTRLLPEGDVGEEGEEELEAPETCAVPCIIMIALACLVFSLLVAGVVYCVCRKRPKNSSPSHQSALNAHPDNAKYYTSCHYASAPVMPRPLETTLCGNRTQTRLLNGDLGGGGGSCSSRQLSPYHQQHEHRPLVTPTHHPHVHAHCHTHLTPLLISANGSPAVALRQGDLPLPPSRSILSYRRLQDGGGGVGPGGEYTSSSAASQTNSDRSHTYESIGDGHYPPPESLRSAMVSAGPAHGVGSGVGVGLYTNGDSRVATLVDPDFCDCECGGQHYDYGHSDLDGYYSDRGAAQTLPIRHFRHVVRDQDSPYGGSVGAGPYSFDIEDSGGQGGRPDSRLSNRSRHRTSSGSHYSDRSFGGYREGQVKRPIPALHPNYFDPPEPPAPDTFKS